MYFQGLFQRVSKCVLSSNYLSSDYFRTLWFISLLYIYFINNYYHEYENITIITIMSPSILTDSK